MRPGCWLLYLEQMYQTIVLITILWSSTSTTISSANLSSDKIVTVQGTVRVEVSLISLVFSVYVCVSTLETLELKEWRLYLLIVNKDRQTEI